MQAELDILRATRLAEFGPTSRDRAICMVLLFDQEPAEEVAERYRLAVRTVENIARTTRDRIAREQAVWRRMSLVELVDEEERLQGLVGAALEGWNAPVTHSRITETRR